MLLMLLMSIIEKSGPIFTMFADTSRSKLKELPEDDNSLLFADNGVLLLLTSLSPLLSRLYPSSSLLFTIVLLLTVVSMTKVNLRSSLSLPLRSVLLLPTATITSSLLIPLLSLLLLLLLLSSCLKL